LETKNIESLSARVSEKGAILLGSLYEVDGYAAKPIRIITHFHSDHLIDLNKSKKHATLIIGTPATLEAVEAQTSLNF
jgi:putative mRNA 3-end processing factor